MTTILETKDLTYKYPDGTEALKGINFKLEEGTMVALLGHNGAGKSTFSYILMVLMKQLVVLLKLKENL